MSTQEITNPGPWLAVATDSAGRVLDIGDLSEIDQRLDAEFIESITVVRGSGAPVHRDGDVLLSLPSECRREDVLYEIEDLGDEPEYVRIVWEQAQAVAAALNAASNDQRSLPRIPRVVIECTDDPASPAGFDIKVKAAQMESQDQLTCLLLLVVESLTGVETGLYVRQVDVLRRTAGHAPLSASLANIAPSQEEAGTRG